MTIEQKGFSEFGVSDEVVHVCGKMNWLERMLSLSINPDLQKFNVWTRFSSAIPKGKALNGWKFLQAFDTFFNDEMMKAANWTGVKIEKVKRVPSAQSQYLAFAKQYTAEALQKMNDDMEARSELIKARLRA